MNAPESSRPGPVATFFNALVAPRARIIGAGHDDAKARGIGLTNQMYAECCQALEGVDGAPSTSECHGMLCGALCAGDEAGPRRWMREVLGEGRDGSKPTQECRALLVEFMQQAIRDLYEPDFSFSPLLPDDEPLATRARALGQWCSGFLYGLGLGGLNEDTPLSADARQVLSDLCELACIDDDVESSHDEEADYAELVEYLRVGVMLIHEETK